MTVDQSVPQRGSSTPCQVCKIPQANNHSLSQSGRCDAIKSGKLGEWERHVGKRLEGGR